MKLLERIASRIAARTEVINAVIRAFDLEGIYSPDMKEIEKGKYEGTIDEGWLLTIREENDEIVEVLLNNRPQKTLEAAIARYKKLKDREVPGQLEDEAKIIPFSGSSKGIDFELQQYIYEHDIQEETLTVSWTDGTNKFLMNVTSSSAGPDFTNLTVNGQDVTQEANNNDWDAVEQHVDMAPYSAIGGIFSSTEVLYKPASVAVENAAHQTWTKSTNQETQFPGWDGTEGTFFEWLARNGVSVQNGNVQPPEEE